jgi:hypothetical protein
MIFNLFLFLEQINSSLYTDILNLSDIEIVFKNNIYPHGNIVSSLLLVEAYFYNNSTFINQWKALRLLP